MTRMIINAGEKWVPLAELNEALTSEGAKDCRIDDLEKALFRYGNHEGGCPAWGRPRPDLCTCGYVAAFKGTYGNHHWVGGTTYSQSDAEAKGMRSDNDDGGVK